MKVSISEIRVSKRFFVTVPDFIGDALDRWAESERNKPATLAAWLIETSIRQALDEGKIPSATEALPKSGTIVDTSDRDRVLKALIDGSEIDETTLALLAQELGFGPTALIQLFKSIREKNDK